MTRSREEDFKKKPEDFLLHLKDRGYQRRQLEAQIQHARSRPRATLLLQSKENPPTPSPPQTPLLPLVVTYHPNLPPLNSITWKHHKVLHVSRKTQWAFPNPPLIAYRRPRNLRDLLVQAELTHPTPLHAGTTPCGQSRNSNCSYVTRKVDNKPVAIHFTSPGHTPKDLQVMVTDQL